MFAFESYDHYLIKDNSFTLSRVTRRVCRTQAQIDFRVRLFGLAAVALQSQSIESESIGSNWFAVMLADQSLLQRAKPVRSFVRNSQRSCSSNYEEQRQKRASLSSNWIVWKEKLTFGLRLSLFGVYFIVLLFSNL